ncbi:endolytic transglycosylase MltG [Devosia nitrariae]|uniref:Endolytic murein transglycosylase n=1 Tax=Devosia nitrariae TaxID=2071872 RepID=A0ABQ5W7F1_9HYPH|nr:endolytic transglycosylase MltG [Devosia nitrariae]GLQ55546.1 aminodeoxychorismate lyase [Devosia nitrariae]
MADRKSRRARPRRRNGFIEILNGLLSLIVLGMLAVGGVLVYGAAQFYGDGPLAEGTVFRVEQGSGLGSISERLENQGLITNRFIFQLGGRALDKQANVKAGDFNIPAGASMADILTEITEGRPIRYAVTLPEGVTSWDVIQRLNDDSNLTGSISSLPAEGSILPGSYDYTPGDTRESVLEKMQKAMAETVAEVWEKRQPDLPIATPEELVILASIVEKETGLASERPQVAAVFVNRLKVPMRLQSDPTIIYGITKGQSTLGRGLRRSEIEATTPYNTYQIDGLPPTPIANPGRESLEAVANPDDHAYLYFVAKGPVPSDGHVFAESYDEHQRNVARWREIEAQAAAEAEREAQAAREALEAAEAAEAEDQGTASEPAAESQ